MGTVILPRKQGNAMNQRDYGSSLTILRLVVNDLAAIDNVKVLGQTFGLLGVIYALSDSISQSLMVRVSILNWTPTFTTLRPSVT